MKSDLIKQLLFDQKDTFNRKKSLIERDLDLTPFLKTRQVVVITGVRRCGKSSLLFLIKQKLELAEELCLFQLKSIPRFQIKSLPFLIN
jgi:predicted AAA+ superfamily ATPase